MVWPATAAGLEAGTAACAALNLAYFLRRMTSRYERSLSRRVAAFVLALVSLGALAESVFVLAALANGESAFASAQWFLVRALVFAGTACVSALVLRALGR